MGILSRPPLTADHRLHYAAGPSQFGDLWLPARQPSPLWPLVVFLHGGWWKSQYDLVHAGFLCAAIRSAGVAVWSIEYRRVGSTGGGWPATFVDVAAGFDYAAKIARQYSLDPARVVTMGHSAGGHLAFWLAGRHHVPAGSPIELPHPALAIKHAISLAGAVDLGLTIELAHGEFAHDRGEVERLMGGAPEQVPERYLAGDPGHLLPFSIPQTLLQGTADDEIPRELPRRWALKAGQQGDAVEVRMLPGAEHMDLVDPHSSAWSAVISAVRQAVA